MCTVAHIDAKLAFRARFSVIGTDSAAEHNEHITRPRWRESMLALLHGQRTECHSKRASVGALQQQNTHTQKWQKAGLGEERQGARGVTQTRVPLMMARFPLVYGV